MSIKVDNPGLNCLSAISRDLINDIEAPAVSRWRQGIFCLEVRCEAPRPVLKDSGNLRLENSLIEIKYRGLNRSRLGRS